QKSNLAPVRINGFLTFAIQRTDTIRDALGNDVTYGDTGTDWDSNSLSRAGLRISANINDKSSAVLQLLGSGEEDYAASMQWAYLQYELSPTLTWRAGRLVLPLYMHSQYTQAGYAYPWIELPAQVYGTLPVDTMEGVDLSWQFSSGQVHHNLNITWGNAEVPGDGFSGGFQGRNQAGINLSSSLGSWSVRLGYASAQTSLALPDLSALPPPNTGPDLSSLSLDNAYGYFASVGTQFDNGQLLLMAEMVRLGIDSPQQWLPTQTAGYVTAGYRIGKLMPHLTWAAADSDDDSDCAAAADPAGCQFLTAQNTSRSKSWTVGARYDLASGIALKAEASRFHDLSSKSVTNGVLFSGLPANGSPMVFRFAVDAVF
ncbi:MAG: porin, partial [Alcanivoracaceae bacterium]|nr:porin [Alcanivoracaceae bacterium]